MVTEFGKMSIGSGRLSAKAHFAGKLLAEGTFREELPREKIVFLGSTSGIYPLAQTSISGVHDLSQAGARALTTD